MLSFLRLLPCWLAAAVAAQTPPTWRVHASAEATVIVVVIEFAHGFDHDPAECRGMARVLAEVRLVAGRRAAPAVRDAGAAVYGDVALVFGAASRPADAEAFAAAVLAAARDVDERAIAQASAKAALAADDAAWLYPGTVLESLARARLLAGPSARPTAGDAASLHALSTAEVRRWLGQPVAAAGAWFGGAPAGELPALPTVAWPPVPARSLASLPRPLPGEAVLPHTRIDGPYVAAAGVVAPEVSRPALALGMEVARSRAIRRLRLTGGEAMARAPAVAWNWREDPPLAMFFRRGTDGGTADRPRHEIQQLLADLVRNPPSDSELQAARRALVAELAGPGQRSSADPGMATLGRALSFVLAERRGLAAVAWDEVPAERVAEALNAVLAERQVGWIELVAVPKARTR